MKNLTILFIALFPLLFFSQDNSKSLSFESKTYDFGELKSKSKAKAIFNFKNNSESTIEIVQILGINHCIEIDSSSVRKYSPNENGIITVIYDTNCKGPIRKTLSVFTSEKESKAISLKLTGKVDD